MARIWLTEDSLVQYLKKIRGSKSLSYEQEAELAERIRTGDETARQELAQANLLFVVSVAKQYQHRGLTLAELISAGNLGLMMAVDRFDGRRGYKFITYAIWRIRQTIQMALAEGGHLVRLPMGQLKSAGKIQYIFFLDKPIREEEGKDHPTFLDMLPDESQLPADERALREDNKNILERLVDALDEPDREVVKKYFGFDSGSSMNLEEIGDEMNLTRERVRQIKDRALRRLRKPAFIKRVFRSKKQTVK